jgi:hypothetical protein
MGNSKRIVSGDLWTNNVHTILDPTGSANSCTARIRSAVLGKRTDKKTDYSLFTERLSRFQPNVDRPARHALLCHCSCPATLLPKEAVFDFRVDLAEPLFCAPRPISVPLNFSL